MGEGGRGERGGRGQLPESFAPGITILTSLLPPSMREQRKHGHTRIPLLVGEGAGGGSQGSIFIKEGSLDLLFYR